LRVDHALEVLHGRRERVAEAIGDRRELADAALAVLELGLDLAHAGGDVADLLDEGVP